MSTWKSRRNPSACAKKCCRPTSGRAAGRKYAPARKPPARPTPAGNSLTRRFFEQLRQVLLPDHRPRMRPVASRLLADRQEDEPRVFHFFDFAVGDAQLRRVDEVVRGIDVHDVRGDFLELRRWIVIP